MSYAALENIVFIVQEDKMTRDEILALTAGDLLNSLVQIKVMGMEACPCSHNVALVVADHYISADHEDWMVELKPYSTELTYAWDVILRMRKLDEHWCPNIFWDDNDGLRPGEWACVMNYYGEDEKDYKSLWVNDASVFVAICKAALLAVEGYSF
jgi:hypothetical protein